jgi:hypothetical protein
MLAALAVASGLGALYSYLPPDEREAYLGWLSQVRSGAQCHYGDGEKGIVLKLSNPRTLVVIVIEHEPVGLTPPAYVRIRPNGTLDVNANGGITTYMAYARTARYLMRKPQTPLTPRDLPAFFAMTEVQACPYKTWSDHAYEDGLREHGRPGQEH